jgi:hypothetical protein
MCGDFYVQRGNAFIQVTFYYLRGMIPFSASFGFDAEGEEFKTTWAAGHARASTFSRLGARLRKTLIIDHHPAITVQGVSSGPQVISLPRHNYRAAGTLRSLGWGV